MSDSHAVMAEEIVRLKKERDAAEFLAAGVEEGAVEWEERVKKAEQERDKLNEENAHLSRELVESRGEEETSQTLAIYESFKDALQPFGHEQLNVRARIECLIAGWQKAERERDELLSRLHLEHVLQDSEKEKG